MSLSCSGITGRSLSWDAQAAQEKAFAHSHPWNQILRHTSAYRTLTLPVSRHVTSEQSKISGPTVRCLGWVFPAPNKSPGYYMEERWVGRGLGISFHDFLTSTKGFVSQYCHIGDCSNIWKSEDSSGPQQHQGFPCLQGIYSQSLSAIRNVTFIPS